MASGIKRAEIAEAANGFQKCRNYQEGAGQSFTANQLVILNGGQLNVAAGKADEKILGMAMEAATGTQTTDILVAIIEPSTVLRMSVANDNNSTAATAVANIGAVAQMDVDGSNNHFLAHDLIGANAASILVIEAIEGTVGEAFGRYLCRIKLDNLLFGSY